MHQIVRLDMKPIRKNHSFSTMSSLLLPNKWYPNGKHNKSVYSLVSFSQKAATPVQHYASNTEKAPYTPVSFIALITITEVLFLITFYIENLKFSKTSQFSPQNFLVISMIMNM